MSLKTFFLYMLIFWCIHSSKKHEDFKKKKCLSYFTSHALYATSISVNLEIWSPWNTPVYPNCIYAGLSLNRTFQGLICTNVWRKVTVWNELKNNGCSLSSVEFCSSLNIVSFTLQTRKISQCDVVVPINR
jgi:hypothetical protein